MTTHTAASANSMIMTRNLHVACPTCYAPGEYRSEEWVRTGYSDDMIAEMLLKDSRLASKEPFFRKGWKECWVPGGDPKRGQGVGSVCPCCGSKRPQPKQLKTMNVFGRLF